MDLLFSGKVSGLGFYNFDRTIRDCGPDVVEAGDNTLKFVQAGVAIPSCPAARPMDNPCEWVCASKASRWIARKRSKPLSSMWPHQSITSSRVRRLLAFLSTSIGSTGSVSHVRTRDRSVPRMCLISVMQFAVAASRSRESGRGRRKLESVITTISAIWLTFSQPRHPFKWGDLDQIGPVQHLAVQRITRLSCMRATTVIAAGRSG
jgi:hypothetical protein